LACDLCCVCFALLLKTSFSMCGCKSGACPFIADSRGHIKLEGPLASTGFLNSSSSHSAPPDFLRIPTMKPPSTPTSAGAEAQNELHDPVGPTGGASAVQSSFWNAVRSLPTTPNSHHQSKSAQMLSWMATLASSARRSPPTTPREKDRSSDDAPTPTGFSQPILIQATREDIKVGSKRLEEESSCKGQQALQSTVLPIEEAGVMRQTSNSSATGGVPEPPPTPSTRDVCSEAFRERSQAAAAEAIAAPIRSFAPSPVLVPVPRESFDCSECGECIQGAVFMLHDMPYCCPRHRLSAYHKMEASRGSQSSGRLAPVVETRGETRPPTGLLAKYATWM
jgi:hypothetical protein